MKIHNPNSQYLTGKVEKILWFFFLSVILQDLTLLLEKNMLANEGTLFLVHLPY